MTLFFVGFALYWALGTTWFLLELRGKDAATRAKITGLGPGLVAFFVLTEGLLHLPYLALRGVGWVIQRWLVPDAAEDPEKLPEPVPMVPLEAPPIRTPVLVARKGRPN